MTTVSLFLRFSNVLISPPPPAFLDPSCYFLKFNDKIKLISSFHSFGFCGDVFILFSNVLFPCGPTAGSSVA